MDQAIATTTPSGALAPLSKMCSEAPAGLISKGLGTVLALVAPSGFTVGDRNLWLRAAAQTLAGIPDDLLRRGIIHARLTCDHPSKVIPAIMEEVGIAWDMRKKQAVQPTATREPALPAPAIEADDGVRMTPDEIRALTPQLRRMALSKGWLTEEELSAAGVVEEEA